jgi:poly(A) polymerase
MAALLAVPKVQRVLSLLNGGGEDARLIGGAVRNVLIGRPVADVDIATTAHPDEVMRRAAGAGIKPVPTGIAHGTVTLVIDGEPVEVTTLREDVATDGRRAEVRFGRDWRADALRRDFTVNALALSADGLLHDYAGGLSDLDPLRIRFIGDPQARIAEDYLRILRFFRFHASYGQGELDRAGYDACIAGREGLRALSRERLRMEVLKLVAADDPVPAFAAMSDAGLWQIITDGVAWPQRLAAALPVTSDAADRLAAAGVIIREDAARLSDRLRLSRAETARLEAYAGALTALRGEGQRPRLRALTWRFGLDAARLAFAVDRPRQSLDAFDAIAGDPPVMPVRAADLIAKGFEPGPSLGAELQRIEADWLARDCP